MSQSEMQIRKSEAVAANGMVASKHRLASQAGVDILRRGGNAVDAAVATAFVIGVVEPWMSGLGGGGLMAIYLARSGQTLLIDYGMVAPAAARPDLYELTDLFDPAVSPWRRTRGDDNIFGYRAVAVPGTVAGLTLALERYGTMDLATVMQCAIHYAEAGFPVDWFTSAQITAGAAGIAAWPETAAMFLEKGVPKTPATSIRPNVIQQPHLAATLRRIATGGAGEFYQGETAQLITKAMAEHGGLLTESDLAGYRPLVHEGGLTMSYRGHQVVTAPAPSGGPTVAAILGILGGFDLAALGQGSAAELHLIAEASRLALADRFARLGESAGANRPWQALLAPEYLDGRRRLISHDRALSDVKDGGFISDGSTTHLAVVDRERNMVSLTQTLLSPFGSRVTIPGAGVLMNNGMHWFNPEPGHANSISAGRRPLSNMSPMLVLHDGNPVAAFGSSGGRRIMGANVQIAVNLIDYGMSMQAAIEAPRIDLSTGRLLADARFPESVRERLKQLGHDLTAVEEGILPRHFASPVGVQVEQSAGLLRSGVDPYHNASAVGF